MSTPPPLVLKFGGSVLRHAADYDQAAAEILRLARPADLPEQPIVAVVSAAYGDSDRRYANESAYGEDERSFIEHVAAGEVESCAVLRASLSTLDLPAEAASHHATGVLTVNSPRDADPDGFDPRPIMELLGRTTVVLVPGHVGLNRSSAHLSLLGRGGSDLSAVLIAAGLGSVCRIYKDVPGVLDRNGQPIEKITWNDLASGVPSINGSAVLQDKAVEYARRHGVVAEVGEIGATTFTRVIGDAAEDG